MRTKLQNGAKKALNRMPMGVRSTTKQLYRTMRSPAPPPQKAVEFPSEVRDVVSLREYLRDTDLFGPAQAEADGYLADALERFRVTFALLPQMNECAEILELGANPYFLTRLMRRQGFHVTPANYFGPKSGFGSNGTQVVVAPKSGERHVFDFDHFNIEGDRFPYDDNQFDVVLFCEILEHLPADPVHTLAEIHRVLKPGGVMVLTTPNASRLENLVHVLNGENMYEEISGYGTYGRHNREYTVGELRDLLQQEGFETDEVFAFDIHDHRDLWSAVPPNAATHDRGCNLFAVVRAVGEPRYRYPDWLYSSKHGLQRVVRADMRVGLNDDVQTSGFHPLEEPAHGPFRWMGASDSGVVVLGAPDGDKAEIVIEGFSAPPDAGRSITLTAEVGDGDESSSWDVRSDGGPFRVCAPVKVTDSETVRVALSTDRTWRPSDIGMGTDGRELSLAISASVSFATTD